MTLKHTSNICYAKYSDATCLYNTSLVWKKRCSSRWNAGVACCGAVWKIALVVVGMGALLYGCQSQSVQFSKPSMAVVVRIVMRAPMNDGHLAKLRM